MFAMAPQDEHDGDHEVSAIEEQLRADVQQILAIQDRLLKTRVILEQAAAVYQESRELLDERPVREAGPPQHAAGSPGHDTRPADG
jgi:hypothetical protein